MEEKDFDDLKKRNLWKKYDLNGDKNKKKRTRILKLNVSTIVFFWIKFPSDSFVHRSF